MKKLIIGILAHVDAGKTTLSESMLYASGNIRKMGRVDHGNTFLDTYELERERGITIFSKQAIMNLQNTQIILLDTPGHIDFSAEMERTLQVLDYAILVISGVDGVQGHTRTVWRLLEKYQIPVFLFINKMDRPETNASELLRELCTSLDSNCISFANRQDPDFLENVAMCDETVLEDFLETGSIEENQIVELIARRKLFPCFFGSALKSEGVEDFLQNLERYTKSPIYTKEFGAKVFKITRDEQGTRLTHMKITGGNLQAKMLLSNATSSENTADIWKEKVNQIRIYSGDKYEAVNEVGAGSICAVTGLTQTFCGEGLGAEATSASPVLEPVLTYQIILPPDCDANATLPKLRQIEEEEPQLHIIWQEELQEIQVQMMGEVQIEILKKMVLDRFGIEIAFGTGKILYKETIANTVEGVGHFEPLRHYSEVHLLLEPLPRGSGLRFSMNCSEDILDKNWQRLVLTHLMEKEHKGILTGSPITDMEISVVSGKAHTKHTEGGDFRQATYRAVRQGLQQADCILLEPYYDWTGYDGY
jgi:small GTP-binding protein